MAGNHNHAEDAIRYAALKALGEAPPPISNRRIVPEPLTVDLRGAELANRRALAAPAGPPATSNRHRTPQPPTADFADALRRARAAEARADDPATSDDDRNAAVIEADAAAESAHPGTVAEVRDLIAHTLAIHGEALDESPLRQFRNALAGLEALAA